MISEGEQVLKIIVLKIDYMLKSHWHLIFRFAGVLTSVYWNWKYCDAPRSKSWLKARTGEMNNFLQFVSKSKNWKFQTILSVFLKPKILKIAALRDHSKTIHYFSKTHPPPPLPYVNKVFRISLLKPLDVNKIWNFSTQLST